MKIRYLEIVTTDVSGTIAILEASHETVFSAPIAELGNGRLADLPDGSKISVRAPMHDAEAPTTRTYFLTNDIDKATAKAVEAGGELAHPVMEIAGHGKFSIFFYGGNQYGFWQD
jgi:predicted enzyme related to lactoylglutathione lyase